MKNLRILAAMSFLFTGPTVYALDIGAELPSLTDKLTNVDGKENTLGSFSGLKGTLVVFSCNHCPYAKAWEDRILELGRKYVKSGLGFVIVNSNDEKAYPEDSFGSMQKRAKAKNYPMPYVQDATSNLAKVFGATKTPEAFLFDTQKKLVYHGAVDDNFESPKDVKDKYLDNAISALLGGKPIVNKETKAIGCSIKFRG